MTDTTLNIAVHTDTIARILLLGTFSFLLSMLVTPIYTYLAYRFEWWKKPRQTDVTGKPATVLNQLHGAKLKRLDSNHGWCYFCGLRGAYDTSFQFKP